MPSLHWIVANTIFSTESWVEIESRPSSSSLSSVNDEIITTGLRVQHDSNARRRRRSRGASQFQLGPGYRATTAAGGSSQEEYEESESESDRVMTSSNEAIGSFPPQHEVRRLSRNAHPAATPEPMSEQDGDDEDDDENATAVNYPRSTTRPFEPRPNAFTHPPGSYSHRSSLEQLHPSRRPGARHSAQRHSYPQHAPYPAISPSYPTDHDEALRASLSTLLSAAAAVRGLPKPGQPVPPRPHGVSTRVEPSTLRIVPESVALGDREESMATTPSVSSPKTIDETSAAEKSERKATHVGNARSSSKDRRTIKKARKTGPMLDEISPTLLTWVVSAGVVVLVSALSFSAGYAVGREAGHAEAVGQLGNVGAEAGRCGKEATSGISRAGMGLRRFRWGTTSGVRV